MSRDRLLQHPLHQQQRAERADIGERQADVDLRAQHDGIEDQAEKQLQREFQLVHDVEEALERLAGEERLDLLARRLVAEQLDLAAVFAGEAQHEFAEAAIAGPFGKYPADDADHVGGRLRGQDPDQVADQEMADGDLLPGIDDEPCRRRGQHGLDHHEDDHHEQRRAEQKARQLEA